MVYLSYGKKKLVIQVEESVTDFPSRLLVIQKSIFPNIDGKGSTSIWAVYQVCNLTCKSIEYALSYRDAQSTRIYDLLSNPGRCGWNAFALNYSSAFDNCYPWTSRNSVLSLLEINMTALQRLCEDPLQFKVMMQIPHEFKALVSQSACSLLNGHRDRTPSKRDDGKYDKAKRLAIPLLQKVRSDEIGDDSDNLAFKLSLEYGYFDGVVQLCHDHHVRRAAKSQTYDLGTMLLPDLESRVKESNAYISLYIQPDYKTGLPFQKFVFRWYTDRSIPGL